MFEPQSIMDLQENSGFGDPKSWLSGEMNDSSSPTARRLQSLLSGGGNMDRVLFNDLVEIVPLVQSLIDRKTSSSFTRRGSIVYTKMPSRESLSRKVSEPKGRATGQSMASKKRRDAGDKEQGKNGSSSNQDAESYSICSSRGSVTEKEMEELAALRGQVEELQRQLLEKDELLKSAEITKSQMYSLQERIDELKNESAEKDSLIKSIQLQLSDSKIKLADKQAALEKTQWEAMTSSNKVEKLQQELSNVDGEVSSFMALFSSLTENGATEYSGDYDVTPYCMDNLRSMDELDATEMLRMEEARLDYIAALAAAREKQDENSIALVAKARHYLQSFVFGTKSVNEGFPQGSLEELIH